MTEHPSLVVCIGGSAGGHDALRELFDRVDHDVDAVFLVVLHIAAAGQSVLPRIVARATDLQVLPATDGAPLVRGRVYVAVA
ncbi:MAG TPA: chemotaxis protein CheB, partial [Actinomycetota bacterium]|nr:chemotaxis protein CheB [Actinomycetota bacterium]